MVIHLLTLGLYIISQFIFYAAFWVFVKYPTSIEANVRSTRAWIASVWLNFGS